MDGKYVVFQDDVLVARYEINRMYEMTFFIYLLVNNRNGHDGK